MIKKVLEQKDLKILASPWSPPRCLKLSFPNRLSGILKPWRYDTYARYLRKWLDAYLKAGIKVSYITPQNEPRARQIWESCTFSLRAQRKLAYKYLTKALDGIDTQILLWDHNKKNLVKVADKLIASRLNNKIAGLCYHWYDGTFPDQMWQVRQKYSNILMISSEMCCGFSPYDEKNGKTMPISTSKSFFMILTPALPPLLIGICY